MLRRLLALVLPITLVACGDDAMKGDDASADCSDGKDNDDDGMVDFPDDLGCMSASDTSEDSLPLPECNDGRDNDSDGKIDYPADPGCSAPNQEGETDDCPSGPGCPQCSDGIDNDNANGTDYPTDPGCTAAGDGNESTFDPNACGPGTMIVQLPQNGIAMGTFSSASTSQITSACGELPNVPAVAYEIVVEQPVVIVASTVDGATTADTVVDIRSMDCDAPASEVMCNDDSGTGSSSEVTASVPAGKYYILVKGRQVGDTGGFMLTVRLYLGEGVPCTPSDMCGPGLVCRTPVGGTGTVCTHPECSDNADSDGDTKNDYPTDPGCSGPDDNDEVDDCPSGPNCPACSNGLDDDNDTHIDYPADPSCSAASGGSEACNGEMDPIITLAGPSTATTMVGMHDDRVYADECSDFIPDVGGLDRAFVVDVPATSSLTLDTDPTGGTLDTVITLLPTTCMEPRLACNDDAGGFGSPSSLTVTNLPAGAYVLSVDESGSFVTPGPFTVNVHGILLANASCEPANTLNGALVCPASNPCGGTMGSRTCIPAQCQNGIDDDLDGRMDYPLEPGCSSPEDNDEVDDCPTGPNCPQCSDGIDNDGANGTDYPADMYCSAAGDDTEIAILCMETDPMKTLTMGTTNSTGIGLHNDREYDQVVCDSGFGTSTGGADEIFTLTVAATSAMTIQTTGDWDTVIGLHNFPGCSDPPIQNACADEGGAVFGNSLITTTALAAGQYILRVDAWSSFTTPDPYAIVVTGTLATGASCEPNKTLNGALVCPAGHPCTGTAGARTCQ